MEQQLKQEFFKLHKRLDGMEQRFATKDDLKDALMAQTKELKDYTDEQTEILAVMINKSIVEPLEEHLRDSERRRQIGLKWLG